MDWGGHLWEGGRTLWLLCAGAGRLLLAPLLGLVALFWGVFAQVVLPVIAVWFGALQCTDRNRREPDSDMDAEQHCRHLRSDHCLAH